MSGRDPYETLGVSRDASGATIKAAWRKLARSHHPDLAHHAEARSATRTMAEINAAYEELRDPDRRRRWDALHPQRDHDRDRERARTGRESHAGNPFFSYEPDLRTPGGPPPPPPSRPVTARFDTSSIYQGRNQTLTGVRRGIGHRLQAPPRGRLGEHEPPRASTPTGPIHRRTGRMERLPRPPLGEAREHVLEFGRFHGRTLGEVAEDEPSYIDWLVRTINRDPELTAAARVVRDDLDERGVVRMHRADAPVRNPGLDLD